MRIAAVTIVLTWAAAVVGLCAQQGVPLTILQKSELSVPWLEAVATVCRFSARLDDRSSPHPGEMIGDMLEGSVLLEEPGRRR